MKATTKTTVTAFGLLSTISASPVQRRDNTSMVHNFADIEPSAELRWTPCFDNFTCSMLEVPLDYTDLSVGNTVVAFIKASSGNDSAEDVLINPGGPGGSGANTVLSSSEAYMKNELGPGFNMVGFDARGVNNSGIALNCFPGNAVGELNFGAETLDRAIDDSTRDSLYEQWLLDRGWGQRCTAVQAEDKPNKYANTVAVANDMLRYTELRAKSLGRPAEESKLFYYGLSYGTGLGQTFATLFPNRIGRMVLDGNLDSADYFGGQWHHNLYDTDEAAKGFYNYCFHAGPDRCPFYGNSSSPDEIEARFFKIFKHLEEYPALIADPLLTSTPVLITWREIKTYFLQALYKGVERFPALASILNDLENGNATSLALSSVTLTQDLPIPATADPYFMGQARTQIACIDANGRFNLSTFEKFEDHVAFLRNQSFYGYNTWAAIAVSPCQKLDIRPPESQVFSGFATANKTSAPILFVGNILDPVTPLRNTHKMSSQFADSAVLTVNGTGHTSRSVPSECARQYLRTYFADGTLPPVGELCQQNELPFMAEVA
ncbi:hypothetical protein K402DRAFT_382243 [Aulographum hederae CBS 113979]|uniref:Uncharacterized protein n=1 Tax=Aulographum hederae CBS 113979 TaxID=1176131 RepID=A0A6G1GSS8_9PEZI|nr:hypothetical protein K402DRAFT_382243 [Aulographum hederae CBS 113979]